MADLRITLSGPQGCGKSVTARLLRGLPNLIKADIVEQEARAGHPQDRIMALTGLALVLLSPTSSRISSEDRAQMAAELRYADRMAFAKAAMAAWDDHNA